MSVECKVNGFPIPSLMWYKNGLQLQLSERISTHKNGVLFIRNAQLLDAGEYECAVWNIAGQSQATVTLIYTGKHITINNTSYSLYPLAGVTVLCSWARHFTLLVPLHPGV